jgi:hypothetical protein
MSNTSLIRLGAFAAIFAGVLRAIASFIPVTASDFMLQLLYLLIDLLIVFGIMVLYGTNYKEIGKSGFFGFLIAIIGIEIVRSSKTISGLNLYPAGALIFSIGLNLFGIALWKANRIQAWVVACWIASILAGLLVYFFPELNSLFPIAGVMFAIGFIGAGIDLWRTERKKL